MNTENNKLIAEFLGANPFPESATKTSFEMYGIIESIEENEFTKQFYLPEEMLFDTDWNWLMEVVEKIQEIGISSSNVNVIKDALWWGDKEQVFIACVEFIKWYNEQK